MGIVTIVFSSYSGNEREFIYYGTGSSYLTIVK